MKKPTDPMTTPSDWADDAESAALDLVEEGVACLGLDPQGRARMLDKLARSLSQRADAAYSDSGIGPRTHVH